VRGSVVQKGGRWYVKIELDPDPLTGRRHQKWHSGYRTNKDAERARTDLLSKLDRGEYVEPSQQTVGAFLIDWLAAIEPTVRPSTFDSYSRNIHNHVIAHIGEVKVRRLDAGTLNGLYALLPRSGRRRPSGTGRGYSPAVVERALILRSEGLTLVETAEHLRLDFDEASHITKDTLASLLRRQANPPRTDTSRPGLDRRTVSYVHTILHRAFRDAVRWGRLARSPADAADPPRAGQKSDGVHAWDAATLRSFLEQSRESGDRLHALWVVLATTGMRRGEAIGLRWRDVALDTGRMRIVQTITQVRSAVTVGEPKTARGRRSIALDGATVVVLRTHRKRMLEERTLVGPDFGDEDLVFHHPSGACLRPDAVSAMFVRRVGQYGLPTLTLHGLRHTWATLALEQGVHPRVVQERLGHSTIAVTLGIYSHVAPTLHDEAAGLVAGLVL
jgi:integrase